MVLGHLVRRGVYPSLGPAIAGGGEETVSKIKPNPESWHDYAPAEGFETVSKLRPYIGWGLNALHYQSTKRLLQRDKPRLNGSNPTPCSGL